MGQVRRLRKQKDSSMVFASVSFLVDSSPLNELLLELLLVMVLISVIRKQNRTELGNRKWAIAVT